MRQPCEVKIWELIIFDFIAALNVGGFQFQGHEAIQGANRGLQTDVPAHGRLVFVWWQRHRWAPGQSSVFLLAWKIIIIIHFYIALFSALEQTHCTHFACDLDEWLHPFIARIFNIHRSAVLTALFGCCVAGATWNWCCRLSASSVYTIRPCTSLQCHFIQSHIGRLHVCRDLNPGPFSLKSDALTAEARAIPAPYVSLSLTPSTDECPVTVELSGHPRKKTL